MEKQEIILREAGENRRTPCGKQGGKWERKGKSTGAGLEAGAVRTQEAIQK